MNGKRVKDLLYVLCTLCAAWGWWGAVYPQFTLLDETYNVVWEKPEEVSGVWRKSGETKGSTEQNGFGVGSDSTDAAGSDITSDAGALYWQILNADSSRIRLKSRLWDNWNALKEGRK